MDPSAPAFVPAADASSNPRGGSRRRDRRGGKRAEGAGQPSTAQAPEAANVSGEPAGSNSHDGPDLRQEKTTRRGRGGKRGAPRQPVSPNPETQNAPENPEPKPLRRPNGPLRGQNGQSGSRRGRSGPRPENGPGRTPSSTSTSSPVAPFPDAPETDDLMTKLIRKLTQGTYECYIVSLFCAVSTF